MHIALMIDLETLGLEENTLILSAGLVLGDLDDTINGRIGLLEQEHFLTAASQKGRTASVSTIDWWMRQIAEGVPLPNADSKIALQQLLTIIQQLCTDNMVDTVWSKGADFDIRILEHAFKQNSMPIPWTYRQPRCFRTVDALFSARLHKDYKERLDIEGTHGALSDARYQYRLLHHYWDFINPRLAA